MSCERATDAPYMKDTALGVAMDRSRRVRRGNATIKLIAAVATVIAVAGGWRLTHPPMRWHDSIDEGLVAAEKVDRPILVLFTAGWCPPCQTLKRHVLKDGEVSKCLRRSFVLVKIDLSNESSTNYEVALEHGVESIPMLKAFDARGGFLEIYDGPRTKEDFLPWARGIARQAGV